RADSVRGGGSAPGGDSGAGSDTVAGPPCVVPGGVPSPLAPGGLLGRPNFLPAHSANSPGSDPSGWPGGRGRGSIWPIGSGSYSARPCPRLRAGAHCWPAVATTGAGGVCPACSQWPASEVWSVIVVCCAVNPWWPAAAAGPAMVAGPAVVAGPAGAGGPGVGAWVEPCAARARAVPAVIGPYPC